jgi:hypothetical protein
MDHDENQKSNIVNEHHAHTEVNGYGFTSKLEERDGKKVLVFSIEKADLLKREEGFTEQEIRFFENGLKKSVSFFDPNIRKPAPDRFNNRYSNNSQPRYNNNNNYNNGNTYNNNRRYNSSNPHPNYKNRYGNWDDDIN